MGGEHAEWIASYAIHKYRPVGYQMYIYLLYEYSIPFLRR